MFDFLGELRGVSILTKNTFCGIIVVKGDATMTYEEYVALVHDYDTTNSMWLHLLDGQPAEKFYNDNNTTLAECDATKLHEYLVNLVGSKRIKTITDYTKYLDEFYKFLIQHGIRFDNPMVDVRNSSKALIAESSKRLPFYTDIDINYILSTLDSNKIFYTALILSFYEGVAANAPELFALNYSDVDFDNSTIKTMRGIKKISYRLSDAFKSLRYIEYVEDPTTRHVSGAGIRRTKCFLLRPEALFVTTRTGISQFCNSRFETLSDRYGTKITSRILYYDGFINFCVSEIGVNSVLNMFEKKRITKEESETFDRLCEQYCLIYKDKGKYQLTPFVDSLRVKRGLD